MPTLTYRPATAADDISDNNTVDELANGPQLRVGTASSGANLYRTGIRFSGIAVPQGTTITNATLTLTRYSVVGTTWGSIGYIDQDNAPVWVFPTNRAVTSTVTGASTVISAPTNNYDVTTFVQAIINRAGWVYGNALAFATTPPGGIGTNLLTWFSKDQSATLCPTLTITFTTSDGDKKISELPLAILPISGSDTIPVVRSGEIYVKQTNVNKLADAYPLATEYTSTTPTAPSTGTKLYASNKADAGRLGWIGPANIATSVQPLLGSSKFGLWSAPGNSILAANNNFSLPGSSIVALAVSTSGTITVRNFVSSATMFVGARRQGFVSAATTAGVAALIGGAVGQYCRSTGFEFVTRFGISTTTATIRIFAGMLNNTTIAGGAVTIASLGNMFCVGKDPADTNLKVFHNDASGSATTIDLGANFPGNTSNVDLYEVRFFSPPGGTVISYSVERLNTGHFTSGTIGPTEIPGSTTYLMPYVGVGTGNVASAVAIDVVSLYTETNI